VTTYQLITHNTAAIELLTTIKTDDHQSAVEQLRDWSGANGYRLATGPGDVEATCTFMQDTGWFDFDDVQSRTDESIQPTKSKEITMVTLKEFCENDPAVAIKALIDGLMRYESIDKFQLDFDCYGTLGYWKDEIYYGGISALVLIELSDLSFAPGQLESEYSRADLMYTDKRDLMEFEEAIELFRRGMLQPIEEYFGLPVSGIKKDWNLQNDTWKDELLKVIYFWEKLTGREYIFVERSKEESWIEAILSEPPSTAMDCLHSLISKGHEYRKVLHLTANQFRVPAKELDAEYCLQHGITTRG
jgi:hypothetical protein